MTDKKPDLIRAPKYDPPYPQDFHSFWPRHAIKTVAVILLTLAAIVALSYFYRVPTDVNMPPMPDEGAYIPGPEWYLIFIFQPFWYLTGEAAVWRPLGTFWVPLAILVSALLLPLVFGRKKVPGTSLATPWKVLMGLGAVALWGLAVGGVYNAGYPAKTTGCMSCHNPMMGQRQALPPPDMAGFYRKERQRQIQVGKYRVGAATGASQSYKDANWQLRHYYEPTMTW